MKKKTQEERLWDVLTRQIGHSRKAKHIFHYVSRTFMRPTKTIRIVYQVDTSALDAAIKRASNLKALIRNK